MAMHVLAVVLIRTLSLREPPALSFELSSPIDRSQIATSVKTHSQAQIVVVNAQKLTDDDIALFSNFTDLKHLILKESCLLTIKVFEKMSLLQGIETITIEGTTTMLQRGKNNVKLSDEARQHVYALFLSNKSLTEITIATKGGN